MGEPEPDTYGQKTKGTGRGTIHTAGWRGRGLGSSDSEGGMAGLQAEKGEGGSGMGVRRSLMSCRGLPSAPGLAQLSPASQCLSR